MAIDVGDSEFYRPDVRQEADEHGRAVVTGFPSGGGIGTSGETDQTPKAGIPDDDIPIFLP